MPDSAALPALLSFDSLIALLTLGAMEIVLGIDNIVFIAILTGKLDPAEQSKARRVGLMGAMFMRIGLLSGITWIMRLTTPLFGVFGREFSGKDLILLAGGLFLIAKATYEIHHKIEAASPAPASTRAATLSFSAAVIQILLLDLVFSLDSVITALGMAQRIEVMIAAVVLAVVVMMVFADPISRFVERHPTIKVLALAFLVLIGVMLVADGVGEHIPKGYIYFAMAFSLGVEMINIRIGRGSTGTHVRAN